MWNDWLLGHLKFMCLFIKVFNVILLNLFWFKYYHYFWMFKNIQHYSIETRIYDNIILCEIYIYIYILFFILVNIKYKFIPQ